MVAVFTAIPLLVLILRPMRCLLFSIKALSFLIAKAIRRVVIFIGLLYFVAAERQKYVSRRAFINIVLLEEPKNVKTIMFLHLPPAPMLGMLLAVFRVYFSNTFL